MSEKTLKFDNIEIDKKSKQPIDLNLVDTNKIVISDKFKQSDDGLNILLVTKKIMLLNRYVLSYLEYMKYFEN